MPRERQYSVAPAVILHFNTSASESRSDGWRNFDRDPLVISSTRKGAIPQYPDRAARGCIGQCRRECRIGAVEAAIGGPICSVVRAVKELPAVKGIKKGHHGSIQYAQVIGIASLTDQCLLSLVRREHGHRCVGARTG